MKSYESENERRRPGQLVQRGGLVGAVALFLSLLVVTPANATAGAITAGFGELQTLVTGTLAVALFGIVVTILGIVMGVKWLRKGATS